MARKKGTRIAEKQGEEIKDRQLNKPQNTRTQAKEAIEKLRKSVP